MYMEVSIEKEKTNDITTTMICERTEKGQNSSVKLGEKFFFRMCFLL